MVIKPIAWSYSSLVQYRNCPRQYNEVRNLKTFKETMDASGIWGERAHKAIEYYLKEGLPLIDGMAPWQATIDSFKNLKGDMHVEQQLALDYDLKPCSWFARGVNVYVRGKIDFLKIAGKVGKAVDWKFGKRKYDTDQLALMALLVFYHYPEVDEVRTMFVWFKEGKTDPKTYYRAQIPQLWELFTTDVRRIQNSMDNNMWPARTSGLCSEWCPVLTCQFNGKKSYG